MRKIAAYVRVSTKEAAKRKEGSLKAQVQRIKMRIEEKNRYNDSQWGSLIDIYKDEALSGKNTDRPEYQRMVGDIAAGKIDTVIVTELSRLSRSVIDFLSFMNFLKGKNADFISLQQDIDTSTPIGKMIVTVMIALYEFEREQTVERIKNNYWVRSLRGMLNGGHFSQARFIWPQNGANDISPRGNHATPPGDYEGSVEAVGSNRTICEGRPYLDLDLAAVDRDVASACPLRCIFHFPSGDRIRDPF